MEVQKKVDEWIQKYNALVTQQIDSEEQDENAKFWNAKYPKTNISYACRPLPKFDKLMSIDPRLLITPDDWRVKEEVKKEGFQAEKGNHDEIMLEIYKWAKKKKYGYAFDWNLYGPSFPEVWEFPFEINERIRIKEQKAADCDSWSVYLKTYWNAAGIPDWKGRIAIGNCNLGGHATLYGYANETEKFHHFNSTYGSGFENASKITKLPTTTDAKNKTDDFGIWGVWFSFNQRNAWNKFITPQDESDFHSFLGSKVIIEPIGGNN